MNHPFPIYDAHNHLQDEAFESQRESVVAAFRGIQVRKAVVNGTCEADWPAVIGLAKKYEWVVPCIGLHPWHVNDRSEDWQRKFEEILDSNRCGIGEIGLDRWIEGHDPNAQEQVFRWQLRQAARRGRPVTIHCLKAWGALDQVLRSEDLPSCGFLLHSYGGPAEMVEGFARLGGFFSLSGYFAHERKARQRAVFRQVPLDRLLLETDAPDMLPPAALRHYLLSTVQSDEPEFRTKSTGARPQSSSISHGGELNHPANIEAVYDFASKLYNVDIKELAGQVENNFKRFFGPLL